MTEVKIDGVILEDTDMQKSQIIEQTRQINDRYKWTTECSRTDCR